MKELTFTPEYTYAKNSNRAFHAEDLRCIKPSLIAPWPLLLRCTHVHTKNIT